MLKWERGWRTCRTQTATEYRPVDGQICMRSGLCSRVGRLFMGGMDLICVYSMN